MCQKSTFKCIITKYIKTLVKTIKGAINSGEAKEETMPDRVILGVTKFCSCYSLDNLRRVTVTCFFLSFLSLYNRASISSYLLRVVVD